MDVRSSPQAAPSNTGGFNSPTVRFSWPPQGRPTPSQRTAIVHSPVFQNRVRKTIASGWDWTLFTKLVQTRPLEGWVNFMRSVDLGVPQVWVHRARGEFERLSNV